MFAVAVTFTIAEGRMAAFLPLMLENARASMEEPGCHRFDVASDPGRADEVFLYELYTDAEAFAAHTQTPHYARFREATDDMIAARDVRTYAVLHA